MKRKLIKFGRSSFVVSIPTTWIKTQNLEKGDYIDVDEKNGSLIFSKEKRKQKQEITLNLNSRNPLPLIISTYLNGYDSITIESKSPFSSNTISLLRDVSNHLTGIELVREGTRKAEYACYIKLQQQDVTKEIRRMYNVASEMLNDALEYLNKPDEIRKRIAGRDRIVNRINFLIQRWVRNSPIQSSHSLTKIAQTIESLSNFVVDLAEMIEGFKIKLKTKLNEESIKLIQFYGTKIDFIFKSTFVAYLNQNKDVALEIISSHPKLEEELKSELWKLASKQRVAEYTILFFLYRVLNYCVDIAKSVVDSS